MIFSVNKSLRCNEHFLVVSAENPIAQESQTRPVLKAPPPSFSTNQRVAASVRAHAKNTIAAKQGQIKSGKVVPEPGWYPISLSGKPVVIPASTTSAPFVNQVNRQQPQLVSNPFSAVRSGQGKNLAPPITVFPNDTIVIHYETVSLGPQSPVQRPPRQVGTIPGAGSIQSRLDLLRGQSCAGVDVDALLVDLLKAPLRVRNEILFGLERDGQGITTRTPKAFVGNAQNSNSGGDVPKRHISNKNNNKNTKPNNINNQAVPVVLNNRSQKRQNPRRGSNNNRGGSVSSKKVNPPREFVRAQFSNFPGFQKILEGEATKTPARGQAPVSQGQSPGITKPATKVPTVQINTNSNNNRANNNRVNNRPATNTATTTQRTVETFIPSQVTKKPTPPSTKKSSRAFTIEKFLQRYPEVRRVSSRFGENQVGAVVNTQPAAGFKDVQRNSQKDGNDNRQGKANNPPQQRPQQQRPSPPPQKQQQQQQKRPPPPPPPQQQQQHKQQQQQQLRKQQQQQNHNQQQQQHRKQQRQQQQNVNEQEQKLQHQKEQEKKRQQDQRQRERLERQRKREERIRKQQLLQQQRQLALQEQLQLQQQQQLELQRQLQRQNQKKQSRPQQPQEEQHRPQQTQQAQQPLNQRRKRPKNQQKQKKMQQALPGLRITNSPPPPPPTTTVPPLLTTTPIPVTQRQPKKIENNNKNVTNNNYDYELSSDEYSYLYYEDYYEELVPSHHRFNQLEDITTTTNSPPQGVSANVGRPAAQQPLSLNFPNFPQTTQLATPPPPPPRPKAPQTATVNVAPPVAVVIPSGPSTQVGPFGYPDKGKFFSDAHVASFPETIEVIYQGFVWAMKVSYSTEGSIMHGGVHTILKDKVKREIIRLGAGDYVVRVSGRASPYNINRLTLYTAKGKTYGPYGDRRSEESVDFDESAPDGQALAFFSGTVDFGVPLRSMSLHWRPIHG